MIWVDYLLIGAFAFGVLSLFNMLMYRHGHKTTIEADLLLKQMRITSRFWTAMGIYRDYLHEWDSFYDKIRARWDLGRETIRYRYGYDLGEFPHKPVLDEDVACLLVDIEENTL